MLPTRALTCTLKGADQRARANQYEQQARDARPNERVATHLKARFLADRLAALRRFDPCAVTIHRGA